MNPAPDSPPSRFWPQGWWRLMELRIGVIPLPVVFVVLVATAYFLHEGRVPNEVCVMIPIIATGGFLCAEVGRRIPLLRNIGGGAICATFLPSALQYYHVLPATLTGPITDFTKSTVFLYLFITAIIVGSILGMDRAILIRGFAKIFVPLLAGSVLALLVGLLVGTALGMGARHTLLFVIVPIMAGGVGEGAIPLSTGYAGVMHQSQGDLFAQVLPPVMLGNLVAVLLAGLLNYVGKKYPRLTGEGRLQPGAADATDSLPEEANPQVEVEQIAAAGLFAISLYLIGLLVKEAWDFPAPVAMLFLAVVAKLTGAVPKKLQEGTYVVYKFFRAAVTYPLLFAVSVAMTPWDKLIAAFALPNLITIFATVGTLVASGFFVGRWINLYPVEAAIVNACHSGQGGTGDVAILTAANRMPLMPFAQIATRIGGAITVTTTLIVLRLLS